MTSLSHEEGCVLNYIKTQCNGENDAATRRIICRQLGKYYDFWLSERELREITAVLLDKGHPIISGDEGIFYCTNPDILERWARRYYSMATKTRERADHMMEIARKQREKEQQRVIECKNISGEIYAPAVD